MSISNEPTEFILTPENFLDVLGEWIPAQLEKMRLYQAGSVVFGDWPSRLEIQYMQTIGGEKFRVVDVTPRGDSGSVYFAPIGQDEDVLLAYARRIERHFVSLKWVHEKFNKEGPIETRLKFSPGPFEGKAQANG